MVFRPRSFEMGDGLDRGHIHRKPPTIEPHAAVGQTHISHLDLNALRKRPPLHQGFVAAAYPVSCVSAARPVVDENRIPVGSEDHRDEGFSRMARILANSKSAVRFVAAPFSLRDCSQVTMEGVANPAMTATTARTTISSIRETRNISTCFQMVFHLPAYWSLGN